MRQKPRPPAPAASASESGVGDARAPSGFPVRALYAAIRDAGLFGIDLPATFSAVRYVLGLFVANHALSFTMNYRKDTATPMTSGKFFTDAVIRVLPLHLWPICFGVVFIPAYMVLMIAWFAGADERVLASVSSQMPAVALVMFTVLKAVCEIPAHLVSHSNALPIPA